MGTETKYMKLTSLTNTPLQLAVFGEDDSIMDLRISKKNDCTTVVDNQKNRDTLKPFIGHTLIRIDSVTEEIAPTATPTPAPVEEATEATEPAPKETQVNA